MAERDESEGARASDVAIIGMAGRFPGAADLERFWDNLRAGVESIARFAKEELAESPLVPASMRELPGFVPAGGVLGDGERFDHAFFDLTPAEARRMDPALRLFLECAWSALEDAGYNPRDYPGKISLYAGASPSYHLASALSLARESPALAFDATISSASMLPMRVAHALDLRGESVSVYTACSTSLVAVHMACQSLLLRQSDVALAGGARLMLPERTGYFYQEGMVLSPDGHCRAFDARAQGTVGGNGAGVVVLKLLEDALRDRDHIHAIIRGSAINGDGADKVGFTAPSLEGQAEVIRLALSYADVDPATIGYVEAHGTGTLLGDPIEIAALTRAYRERTDQRGYCAIGSVKTNIGHLDAAAGVAGLIKAALALSRAEIPPSLHFEHPNPELELAESPFYVSAGLAPFPSGSGPRRASVSSFGIGGTNAHAVLEEAPPLSSGPSRREALLLPISARTEEALDALTERLASHIEKHTEQDPADIAYTLSLGRRAFAQRRVVVGRDRADLARKLRERSPAKAQASKPAPRVALLFPGQGAQAAGMGADLYRAEPLFRRHIDEAGEVLRRELGFALSSVIAPPPERRGDAERSMDRLEVGLPALLAVEYALAELWASWGVRAEAFLGHSFGEYTAACLSGVLRFEDALRTAHARGRLVSSTAPGRMLSVALAPAEIEPLLGAEVELSAINARERSVVSGPPTAMEALAAELARRGVPTTWLPANRAFHSALLTPILGELEAVFRGVSLRAPARPYLSSRTGTWIRSEQATDPAYWAAQMRDTVRFSAGLDALLESGVGVVLEAGPDQALVALSRAHLGTKIRALPSLPRAGTSTSAHGVMLSSLGALWAQGITPDWGALYRDEERRRVPLPTYPFAGPRFEEATPPAPIPITNRLREEAQPATPAEAPAREKDKNTEARVAALWCELLGVEQVDVNANFLEIGGNSLVAAQVLTRLRDLFDVDISLGDLFDALTVRDLAARIDERRRRVEAPAPGESPRQAAPRAPLPRIEALGAVERRPVSYVEERVLKVQAREPQTAALNMPIFLRLTGALDVPLLQEALDAAVARHEGLRTVYRREGSGAWTATARVHAEVKIVAQALTEPTSEERRSRATALMVTDVERPFDVERGPLLRAALFETGPAEHYLALTVHHLVSDTGSIILLARELLEHYDALTRGERWAPPPLPICYGDYAAWQRSLVSGGALDAQLEHWRRRLAGMPSLTLPTDSETPEREGLSIGAREIVFPAALSRELHDFSQSLVTTPFVALLSAYCLLLARHANQDEVVVGTPIGNRNRPELAPLIGYVAQCVALRVDLGGDPTFTELVRRVRETVLEAQDHADLPFELLADELGRTRDPLKVRLFDAAFVFQNRTTAKGMRPALGAEPQSPATRAQFDATLGNIALHLTEGDETLRGELHYNPEMVGPTMAERLAGHLIALLDAALAAPETPIRSISLDAATIKGVGRFKAPNEPSAPALRVPPAAADRRPLELSIFYFAADEQEAGGRKYRLLLDGARRADQLGFTSIWTPERHFHSFGAMYPNPAVTSAAIAAITERVGVRAGSVVLPLHHPARVAEEWSVIDNLSGGRAGIAVASGWHVRDFVFSPGQYAERRKLLEERLDQVRRLWRGEELRFVDGAGKETAVRVFPRPIQRELPIWLTSGGALETFRLAGRLGANLLTNLMGQRFEDLSTKIAAYREAWEEHGHGPGRGHVTLMMHAYVSADVEEVRRTVREPLLAYLRSSVDVAQGFAATTNLDVRSLSPRDLDKVLALGFDRYVRAAGLFGTPESCAELVEQVRRGGVDEIACLIDFGIPAEAVIEAFDGLATLLREVNQGITRAPEAPRPLAIERRDRKPAPPPQRRPPPIRRADRGQALPLSFIQQRLWFLDQLTPGSAAYNNSFALALSGPVDVAALERSFNEVIARHEVLRTAFVMDVSEAPTQRILGALTIEVPIVAIPGGGEEQRAELNRRITALGREPFRLDEPPLLRAALFRLGEREHVLAMVMHHIISDGWSGSVLFAELGALYQAFSRGQPSPLTELQVQYADYSVWQREWLSGEVQEAEIEFWREALAETPLALDLPIDRPRPKIMSARGARIPVLVPAALVDRMAALARASGATLFMALLAIFGALLGRHSGQERLVVGGPTAGRSRPEVERLLGCFINTVVFGIDLRGDPSFRELLGRARRTALAAFEHMEISFERVVDALVPERDLSRPPLVQAVLVTNVGPAPHVRIDDLEFSGLSTETETSKFELTLELNEAPEGLIGALEYATDLFTEETASRVAQRFVRLFEAAVNTPDEPMSSLSCIGDAEAALLSAWSSVEADYPRDALIHELFEERARESPSAIAVEYEDQSLTYGELDARANQLSHWLRALGVGPEVRVALCVERSLEMVVGLLAILKAGGAYVPLDPDYPSERMAFMMADARAAVLLTQSSLKERLPAREARVICLDAGAALWSERPRTAPKSFATAENLAYILFTSGSTGVPKGVAVPHRGVVRLVREANYASFHRDDIFVQLAPLAFDASTLELWAPLLNGAKLVVHRRGPVVLDELAEALVRRRVTTLWLTAGLFHSLVDVAPESLRGVRQLLTGGDVVSPTHARLALGLTSGALVNGYGPTENTTFTACHRVELSDTEGERVPIGVPVSNTSVYVLDVQLRQVPVGVAGEIYAAGDGLARGYQGRPGLTAERFVPNPFSATPGARLYRTGDRARWTDRGRLDFLGRLDQQVKIRGFRIELAEIEGCLGRHPAVGQAVVAAREDSPGEKRLVAYLVARLDVARPTALELREHLKRSLPDSMIPAAFLWLDAVPLTARGKVDRRALPAPEGSREGIGTPYLEPRSELEGAIAGVFAEVLRMPRVSVLDGFFALGGDSILAIQIVSRLRRAGIHVSPRDIFEHPTAAKLAQVAVRAAAGVAAQEAAVGAALLTPIQRRFFDAEPIEPHHFNQALLWNVSTALTPDIVSAALEACLRQHDALRLRYRRSDAGWLQEHASEASWPLARLDLSTVEPQERPKALEVFADALHAGLSLSSGPLARAAWIDRGEAGAQLLLVIHHLVVDGVSWRALHEDLESAARSFVSSQEPSLGPKTVSFQAWSERLHRWVAEGGLDDEIPYWQAECARPIPALPLDRAAPLGAEGELRVAEIALSEQETRSLIRDAGAAYHTEINDLLLAALADALRAFWGVDNVCVGLEGHGREPPSEDLDISRTVGWFTSLFPVWLHVPRGGGKGALIKEIKERLRRIPRRGFGYGWLRYAHSDPAVRASLSQDPPVVFNYLGQIDIETNAQRHFSAADGPTGAAVSPRASAREALSISGAIWRARLRFGFRYSPRVHDEATIQRLAERFRESLVELINHTCSGEAFGYTPSDFPSARLDQATLDRWIGDVRGVEAIYPLSPLQVGMLFHALRDPESPTYTVQLALEVGAEVDIDALAEAWRRVIARHAVYRTYFVWQDVPEPLQVVLRDVPFAIDRYDLSSLSSDAADARWEAILREDRLRPFDFSRAPLLRITCARFPGGRTWLLKTEHHILSDGWSGPLVLGEVQAIYRGIRAGVIPRMPDPAPYERYIAWLSRRDRAASEAFFRRYLRGVTEPSRLLLPAPDGAPTGAPHENSTLVVDLSPDETAQISTFAKRHGLTVNTALQGALSILLAQRAGRSDVVLGVVTSGRSAPVPGIEQMVGLFINTVPLRARFGPSDRVAPWLSSLQADQVDVRVHEATPLWDVQRLSEIPGYQPLFDTLLVFENYPVPEAAASDPSLPFLRWRSFDQTSYPLTVAAFLGSSLTVKLAWEPAALRRADVERLGAELKALLIRFASSPDERLHGLPLLTEAEDADSIAWSGASVPYPASKCVHELVEEQVDRRPDKVAVEFGDERLTYAALDARSNRLARYLRARGVGPEVRVAQYADRSIEMVIGALAILKAGGVYVPLDPDQPNERLSYIAGDSGAALLLAQRSLLRDAPAVDVPVVELDAEVTVASAQAEERFPSPSGPGNAAYIIYTSGTTGRPKGVLVEHRGLCNFIVMLRDACQVVSDSRVLQMARFGFDASLSELFRTLTAGATLHVATREQTLPGPGLLALLRDQRISVVTLTPTVLAALPSGALPDLRTIISGGEACSAALVDRWAHGRLFFNVYGPTEITICATIALCSPGRGAPPIGRPLPNYRAYVLDPALRPVPRGVIGELCIGGVGVARGYLNRPALTAERFMPDPFSLEAGARMYRTGDFARRRDDGQIEFLGRRDHQVKIRGIRVELGEIEAALVSYPAVRACAVLARKDNPGEIRLVAYVIPGEGDCSSAAMRRHLRASLPEVMVPSAFVRLASLPLTSTGKIDRNALPAPESAQPEDERAYVAPRSPDEERLAAIWAELLRVDRVGVFDNFFDRGGNSILAIQVVGRARRAGISLAVKHLFERPTIAALAAAAVPVEARAEEAGVSGLVPLTPIQRLFFERGSPEPHHFNQAILLKVEGDLREDLLEQALNAVLSHHDAFRLRYRRDGSAIVQSYAVVGEPLSLRRVDLSAAPAEAFDEAIDAASTEIQVSLDLERGPLIRAALFALGPGRSQRLLLVAHHLVVDGVSWRVLLEDLRDLHDQLARGEAPRLPPKTTSFQRFALRLVDFARSESIEGQLAFWRSMSEAPRLPTDRALGPNTVASSRDVDVELGVDETRALLRGLGQARTARVNAVFLTALMCAISPWIGARRLRINLEGHGREDIGGELDVSRTVGWFTTVFPVELELPEGAPSRALDVIQDQLDRIPHRGIGYGLLRYLHPDPAIRDELQATPGADVVFNYLGELDTSLPEGGLFAIAREPSGRAQSPKAVRGHVLEVNTLVVQGRLKAHFTYSENLHERGTIEALSRRFLHALRDILAGVGAVEPCLPWLASSARAPHGAGSVPRAAWSPLLQLQASGRGRPFFCVHAISGTAIHYSTLASRVGRDRPFYGLQARGLEVGEAPITRLDEMVAEYVEAVRRAQPSGPYLVGGYSFGAIVAYEMARRLLDLGERVASLVLIDPLSPHTEASFAEQSRQPSLDDLFREDGLALPPRALEALAPDEQRRRLIDIARRFNRALPGMDDETVLRVFSLRLATRLVAWRYMPRPYGGPITILRARKGSPPRPGRNPVAERDPARGWSALTPFPVHVHDVPGDHDSLFDEENIQELADKLRACLLAADPLPGEDDS